VQTPLSSYSHGSSEKGYATGFFEVFFPCYRPAKVGVSVFRLRNLDTRRIDAAQADSSHLVNSSRSCDSTRAALGVLGMKANQTLHELSMSVIDDLRPALRNSLQGVRKYLRTLSAVVFRPSTFLATGCENRGMYLTALEFAGINIVVASVLYNLASRLVDDPLESPASGFLFSVTRVVVFLGAFGALWVFFALVIPRLWQKTKVGTIHNVSFKKFVESLTYMLAGPGLLYLHVALFVTMVMWVFVRRRGSIDLLVAAGMVTAGVLLSQTVFMIWLATRVIKTFYRVNIARSVVLPSFLFVILLGLANYFGRFESVGKISPEEREAARRLSVIGSFVGAHFQREGSWNPDIASNLSLATDRPWQDQDPLLFGLLKEAATYQPTMVGYRYSMFLYRADDCVLTAQPQRYQPPTQLSFTMYCPKIASIQFPAYAEDARGGNATASGGRQLIVWKTESLPWYYPRPDSSIGSDAEASSIRSTTTRVTPQSEVTSPHIAVGPTFVEQADHSLLIEWKTDVESTTAIQYGMDRKGPFLQAQSPGLTLIHRIRIDQLQPGARYYITVRSASAKLDETFITFSYQHAK
jgi:hypothetical protein